MRTGSLHIALSIALAGCSGSATGSGDPVAEGTDTGSSGLSDPESGSDASTDTTAEADDGTDDTTDDGGAIEPDLPPETPPDPAAPEKLFSHDYLPVYRITMHGADWSQAWDYLLAQLDSKAKCAERPFIEADIEFENPWTGETEAYEQVGFRIRGHDLPEQILSQPDERFGFKMSFVEYVPGRRFHGQRRLNFLSSERDDTLMRQCLVYEIMRDFDVPTARCNFASVYVNGDYVGVFAHVEERDDGSYVQNRFPDDPDGSMYEFGDCWGDEEDVMRDLGPDVQPYAETYQLEAGTVETDILTDLIPFSQCASAPQQEFEACIEDHIHLDEWHRAMASILAIPEMDGWASSSSNFVMYNYGPLGASRRFVVFPWDVDRAFKDTCDENDDEGDNLTGPCHIMAKSWEDGMSPLLVNRLREPPFRAGFCAAMESFVEQLYNPAAIASRVADLRTRPRLAAKPFEGMTEPSLEYLMQHDPLWDHARFMDGIEDIVEERVPDRHAALVQQLMDCEMSPLVDG
ncbi:Cellulosomal protein [Enhygromyxa salina]|uniref:Cellulosomal protein n=1 Tax=Enhygromyxa salina TaxID=215803 RepID=A0A0C2D2Q3_9BACT|nr:Cellulosomal protein [Enhygromyxa salina]